MIWDILGGAVGGALGWAVMTWWYERRQRRRWFNKGPLDLP